MQRIRFEILALALLAALAGCKADSLHGLFRVSDPLKTVPHQAARFERTLDKQFEAKRQHDPPISVRFEGMEFSRAMQLLADLGGVTIIWSKELDEQTVAGSFVDLPLSAVLEAIARRYSVSVSETQGVYCLGEHRREDTVTAVVRIPPVDKEEFLKATEAVSSENGHVSVVGSVLWVVDRLENVRRILADVEEIRNRLERSYIAEVYFVRLSESDFAGLTAELRFQAVDVFASGVNIEELFEAVLSGDAGLSSVSVDSRPVLYLSEGRLASFEVGTEITRPRSAVNDKGVIENIGYDTFRDGLTLSLQLSRISDDSYSVDMELEVSTFDRNTSELSIPDKKNSVLRSPGLLLKDGRVCFAGQVRRSDKNKTFGLIGFDVSRTYDLLTVWVRVREVR